jgi:hypothetical protein
VPPTPTQLKTIPPNVTPKGEWLGFTKNTIHDSFFWSVMSCYATYGCKIPDSILELRELAVKQIKKGILGIKLKDLEFNNYHNEYRQWLTEFEAGMHGMDSNFIVAQALATATHRPFIFVSSLEEHSDSPIFKFNADSLKPPLIFGVYQLEGTIGFLPYFYNKNLEFSIESLYGKVQVIAYMAKSVGENFKTRSILDLEAFSILESLHSLRKYISKMGFETFE